MFFKTVITDCEVEKEPTAGTHIAADLVGDTYVTLVDYQPGSKLDLRLAAIEAKMDAEGRLLYAPWRPIETAPKDGSQVLLYEGSESLVCEGYWDDGWNHPRGYFWRQPTHWMPLPEPPK